MLEQDFGAIDWIAPIAPEDIPGAPLDLSPSCHVGPTLAALGDPTAITAMTVPPPEYHFGIPLNDLLIAIITVGLALSLAYIAWHILTQNGLRPLFGGKRRHHHHRNYRDSR